MGCAASKPKHPKSPQPGARRSASDEWEVGSLADMWSISKIRDQSSDVRSSTTFTSDTARGKKSEVMDNSTETEKQASPKSARHSWVGHNFASMDARTMLQLQSNILNGILEALASQYTSMMPSRIGEPPIACDTLIGFNKLLGFPQLDNASYIAEVLQTIAAMLLTCQESLEVAGLERGYVATLANNVLTVSSNFSLGDHSVKEDIIGHLRAMAKRFRSGDWERFGGDIALLAATLDKNTRDSHFLVDINLEGLGFTEH